MEEGALIVAIVGMPGAGKSEVAAIFTKKGFALVRLGKETEEGLIARGLLLTPENERMYREELREKLGMAAYAIKAKPKIDEHLRRVQRIVIDGLYSWEEYLYFKEVYPGLQILAVITEPAIRYKRLSSRATRPFSKEETKKRDIDEIEKVNKAGPIAIADYFIENNGTRRQLRQKVEALLQRLDVS